MIFDDFHEYSIMILKIVEEIQQMMSDSQFEFWIPHALNPCCIIAHANILPIWFLHSIDKIYLANFYIIL